MPETTDEHFVEAGYVVRVTLKTGEISVFEPNGTMTDIVGEGSVVVGPLAQNGVVMVSYAADSAPDYSVAVELSE